MIRCLGIAVPRQACQGGSAGFVSIRGAYAGSEVFDLSDVIFQGCRGVICAVAHLVVNRDAVSVGQGCRLRGDAEVGTKVQETLVQVGVIQAYTGIGIILCAGLCIGRLVTSVRVLAVYFARHGDNVSHFSVGKSDIRNNQALAGLIAVIGFIIPAGIRVSCRTLSSFQDTVAVALPVFGTVKGALLCVGVYVVGIGIIELLRVAI